MTRIRSAPLHFLALVLIPLAGSCADPEKAYSDFADRWDRIHAANTDAGVPDSSPTACTLPNTADLQTPFLFALSARISPKQPIVCVATITRTDSPSGPALSMSIQPLLSADRRTPTGAPIVGGPFPLNADGSFSADFGTIQVNGDANPISGSDLVATVTLSGGPGAWCKPADFVCGQVTGIVSKPLAGLNLSGSTFTFQRITDPNSYPQVVINCDKTVAPL